MGACFVCCDAALLFLRLSPAAPVALCAAAANVGRAPELLPGNACLPCLRSMGGTAFTASAAALSPAAAAASTQRAAAPNQRWKTNARARRLPPFL